jgi:hypothetical protein
MRLTTDNQTIECKTSDSQWPPGQTQGKQCTGRASWLEINGRWHRWEGTGSQLVEALELAEVSALAEWIECYAKDLVEFQEEGNHAN